MNIIALGLAKNICFPFPFSHLLDLAELDATGSHAALLLQEEEKLIAILETAVMCRKYMLLVSA